MFYNAFVRQLVRRLSTWVIVSVITFLLPAVLLYDPSIAPGVFFFLFNTELQRFME